MTTEVFDFSVAARDLPADLKETTLNTAALGLGACLWIRLHD